MKMMKITTLLCCLVVAVLPLTTLAETTMPPEDTTTAPPAETTSMEQTTSVEPETTMPTTEPTTQPTTQPTTPTPLAPYVVKDRTTGDVCVVIKADFTVTIPYESNEETQKQKSFEVSKLDPTTTGDCGDLSDVIDITFNRNWGLSVTIERMNKTTEYVDEEEDDLELADVTYFWKELTLKYTLDPMNFPDAAAPTEDPIEVTTQFDDGTTFVGTSQGSFQCNYNEDLNIGDQATGITLKTTTLQYRAFGETPDENFPDTNVAECPNPNPDDDDDDKNIVAIVLGSLFGSLILAILTGVGVGVLCYRRRSRRNYEQV